MTLTAIIETLIPLVASVLQMAQGTSDALTPEEFAKKIDDEMQARDFLIANAQAAEKKLMDAE